jgi:hypothetical protein
MRDKNERRRVRGLEGSGNGIFAGTLPTLDRKFETQSEEPESVWKSDKDDIGNAKIIQEREG